MQLRKFVVPRGIHIEMAADTWTLLDCSTRESSLLCVSLTPDQLFADLPATSIMMYILVRSIHVSL
uniref:Uncharacterized protein n=1 Tax=Arundo donax TaxID=35708 RepID=A0A0A9F1A8_ARUDO